MMLRPEATAASRKSAAERVSVSSATSSSSAAAVSTNLRMLTDQCTPGDVRDHHVQPTAVGQHRVDERGGQVDPAARRLEHLLDQVTDLGVGQDDRRQLAATPAGDEDPARTVDPDLLDRRVLEQPLQRAEAGDRVVDPASHVRTVVQRRQRAADAALLVLGDDLVDQPADGQRLVGRVDPPSSDELPDLVLDHRAGIQRSPPRGPKPLPIPESPSRRCGRLTRDYALLLKA